MSRVSIILPVFNGERFLKQAINSVLVQSFSDWELIAVNDGSTDGSASIIKWHKGQDSRIKIIEHKQNAGLVACLNEGIEQAAGKYIARLDCDDWWSEPQKLSKQADFLDAHPKCALVGTWAEFITPEGKHLKDLKPPQTDSSIRKQMLIHNCFVHSSIMARKDAMLRSGKYRPEERHVEDYGLWLRIGQFAELANLPEIMLKYRVMSSGVTKVHNREQITRVINLIRQFKNAYPNYCWAWLKWKIQNIITW